MVFCEKKQNKNKTKRNFFPRQQKPKKKANRKKITVGKSCDLYENILLDANTIHKNNKFIFITTFFKMLLVIFCTVESFLYIRLDKYFSVIRFIYR